MARHGEGCTRIGKYIPYLRQCDMTGALSLRMASYTIDYNPLTS